MLLTRVVHKLHMSYAHWDGFRGCETPPQSIKRKEIDDSGRGQNSSFSLVYQICISASGWQKDKIFHPFWNQTHHCYSYMEYVPMTLPVTVRRNSFPCSVMPNLEDMHRLSWNRISKIIIKSPSRQKQVYNRRTVRTVLSPTMTTTGG